MALEESKTLNRYFDRIASNYQFMNRVLSLNLDSSWRESLYSKTRLKNQDHILDIACGTCDVVDLIIQKKETQGVYVYGTGLDLSFGMLRESSKRTLSQRTLVRADGVRTPFANHSFHLITISFGYRNMPSHKGFLKEAFRILKPGGQLLILELTQPQNPLLKLGNTIYLKTVLPTVSSLFGKDPEAYEYLARSIQAFPHQNEVLKDFKIAGFENSGYSLLHGGITTLFEGLKPGA